MGGTAQVRLAGVSARRVVACLVLVVTIAAACSSSGGGKASPKSTTTTPSSTSAAQPGAGAWPTYHRDATRTGVEPSGPSPGSLRRVWETQMLDGAIYAEPLFVGSQVFVATEGNTVYAMFSGWGQYAYDAAYRLLTARYLTSVGASDSLSEFDDIMDGLCYPLDRTTTDGDSESTIRMA